MGKREKKKKTRKKKETLAEMFGLFECLLPQNPSYQSSQLS